MTEKSQFAFLQYTKKSHRSGCPSEMLPLWGRLNGVIEENLGTNSLNEKYYMNETERYAKILIHK